MRVTLEEALLTAVDEAAARAGETRSAFAQTALFAEVKRRQNAALEVNHEVSHCETPDDDAWLPTARAWSDDSMIEGHGFRALVSSDSQKPCLVATRVSSLEP